MPSSCWAPNCSNRLRKWCSVKMYRFPQSNAERLNRWIVNIARFPRVGQISKRADGLHEPKEHDRLCSDHFVKGKPSNDPKDIDYVPSIFKMSRRHSSPKIQSRQKGSYEPQSVADSTTNDFALYRDDEREAAISMLLLQDAVFPPAEASSQRIKKPKRTLKVVQLNNLVYKSKTERLDSRHKNNEGAVQQMVETQL